MSEEDVQAAPFIALNEDMPGTQVDPRSYLARGKYTIVEYFSPFDDKSASLQQSLRQLVQVRSDLAVRTVNINRPEAQGVDWESPVVQELEIQTLPHLLIYDPAGRLRAQGRPAFEQVTQWVQQRTMQQ
jgi:hypothetical protein